LRDAELSAAGDLGVSCTLKKQTGGAGFAPPVNLVLPLP
jgi:hypothetical protein